MPVLANGERLVFKSDRHGAPVARHFFFDKLGNYERKPVRRAGQTVFSECDRLSEQLVDNFGCALHLASISCCKLSIWSRIRMNFLPKAVISYSTRSGVSG